MSLYSFDLEPKTPEQKLCFEITDRISRGMDEPGKAAVCLYIMDLIHVAAVDQVTAAEELIQSIQSTESFKRLDTITEVPNELTLSLIKEIRSILPGQV